MVGTFIHGTHHSQFMTYYRYHCKGSTLCCVNFCPSLKAQIMWLLHQKDFCGHVGPYRLLNFSDCSVNTEAKVLLGPILLSHSFPLWWFKSGLHDISVWRNLFGGQGRDYFATNVELRVLPHERLWWSLGQIYFWIDGKSCWNLFWTCHRMVKWGHVKGWAPAFVPWSLCHYFFDLSLSHVCQRAWINDFLILTRWICKHHLEQKVFYLLSQHTSILH